tara:strand:+ start:350 stop:580 length:231 start_codon:yes stop_codon:yes gene_type:complete
MTDNERLIWAATYSAEYVRQMQQYLDHGIDMQIVSAIESAWDAVDSARQAYTEMRKGFDETDEVYTMLCDMIPEVK